jgi:two-component system sensor histidine kinase HydH
VHFKNKNLLKKSFENTFMPIFIDGHHVEASKLEQIKNTVNKEIEGHGVSTLDLFYNHDEQELYCILEAINESELRKYHATLGLVCDFITPIERVHTQTKDNAEKFKTIGELAARLAHDLRNPLSIIKNTVEIMENKQKLRLEERVIYYGRLRRAIERISHQIEDVLDFVRPVTLTFKQHLVNEILASSLEKIIKPDTVEIKMPENFVYAVCDFTKLEVVFTNLLMNSIQAMNNSGQIVIKFIDKDDGVSIWISDTGHGIPGDVLPKIFEPLFTTKQIGTGLGLASCKQIVEQHHGRIDVASTEGKGTTFTITLPKNKLTPSSTTQLEQSNQLAILK